MSLLLFPLLQLLAMKDPCITSYSTQLPAFFINSKLCDFVVVDVIMSFGTLQNAMHENTCGWLLLIFNHFLEL